MYLQVNVSLSQNLCRQKMYGKGAKSLRGMDGCGIMSGFQYKQVFCVTSCNFMVLSVKCWAGHC